MRSFDVLIVGTGHGGASTATALRQRKFGGTIAIVGEEPELPYERPPLSKEYLAGEKPFERLFIRPPAFWAERDVEILTGRRIVAVDPTARTVATSDGERMGYGTLVWAAGGHARRLTCAGHDLARVHSVRSRADVDRMMIELPSTDRICVVGGGYIGLESAAVLRKLGKQVTVLEAQDRVLARAAGPTLSAFYATEHRRRGVELHLGTGVDCIEGFQGQATGARLADGRLFPCDMVVVGVGIVPAVTPLLDAGAKGGNGVAVDAFCATSLPNVYAVGDCALHCNVYAGRQPIRLESVQNANDQAMTVARAITLDPAPYDVVPSFWSNQYDLKLQTIGLAAGYDTEVVRGSIAAQLLRDLLEGGTGRRTGLRQRHPGLCAGKGARCGCPSRRSWRTREPRHRAETGATQRHHGVIVVRRASAMRGHGLPTSGLYRPSCSVVNFALVGSLHWPSSRCARAA